MLAFRPGRWVVASALCALAYAMGILFGGALQAAGPVPKGAQGVVTGKISYTGTVPPAQKRKLIEDPTCAALHKDGLELQSVLVKDGGLAEVLVYVKTGLTGQYSPPPSPCS